jgi:hypothetical protein
MRKKRKESGTLRQLEGPAADVLGCRASTSDTAGGYPGEAVPCDGGPCDAIIVDDVLVTGSSLVAVVELMREVYAIRVIGAVYLIDRAADRDAACRQDEKFRAIAHMLRELDVVALYDVAQVEDRVRDLRGVDLRSATPLDT